MQLIYNVVSDKTNKDTRSSIKYMIKATHFQSSFPKYESDSAGRFIFELCEEINKDSRVRIRAIAPRSNRVGPYDSPFEVEFYPYFIKKYETLPNNSLTGLSAKNFVELPFYLISSLRKALSVKTDLLHVHFAIPFGFLSSFNKKTPIVLTCHGSDVNLAVKNILLKQMVKKALKRANYITCTAQHILDKALLLGANPKKAERVPLGVNTDFFNPKKFDKKTIKRGLDIPKNAKVVGIISQLRPEKRAIDLVRAIPHINKSADTFFVFGGGGSELENLKKEARTRKINNILFLDQVSRKEVVSTLSIMDAFVLPSETEGLPMALQEAMAMNNVPVVSDKVLCPELKIKENGFVFKCGDVKDLSKKVLQSIEQKSSARKIIVKEFNIKKTSKRFIEVYEELLK